MSTRKDIEGVKVDVITKTADFSLDLNDCGGIYIMSASAGGVVTGTLPAAVECAGSQIIFRAGTLHDAYLTGSGDSLFQDVADQTQSGQAVVISGSTSSAYRVTSDGARYRFEVLAGSGTIVA